MPTFLFTATVQKYLYPSVIIWLRILKFLQGWVCGPLPERGRRKLESVEKSPNSQLINLCHIIIRGETPPPLVGAKPSCSTVDPLRMAGQLYPIEPLAAAETETCLHLRRKKWREKGAVVTDSVSTLLEWDLCRLVCARPLTHTRIPLFVCTVCIQICAHV